MLEKSKCMKYRLLGVDNCWEHLVHQYVFLLLSFNSVRRSFIKTRYKKVDKTPPCLTPWLTLNHFDCIWFTMTELVVCWWQLLISVHILPVTSILYSLNISPSIHTISNDLPESKKLTYTLLPCSVLCKSVFCKIKDAVKQLYDFWKPCCWALGK